jgi:hypothetical protein
VVSGAYAILPQNGRLYNLYFQLPTIAGFDKIRDIIKTSSTASNSDDVWDACLSPDFNVVSSQGDDYDDDDDTFPFKMHDFKCYHVNEPFDPVTNVLQENWTRSRTAIFIEPELSKLKLALPPKEFSYFWKYYEDFHSREQIGLIVNRALCNKDGKYFPKDEFHYRVLFGIVDAEYSDGDGEFLRLLREHARVCPMIVNDDVTFHDNGDVTWWEIKSLTDIIAALENAHYFNEELGNLCGRNHRALLEDLKSALLKYDNAMRAEPIMKRYRHNLNQFDRIWHEVRLQVRSSPQKRGLFYRLCALDLPIDLGAKYALYDFPLKINSSVSTFSLVALDLASDEQKFVTYDVTAKLSIPSYLSFKSFSARVSKLPFSTAVASESSKRLECSDGVSSKKKNKARRDRKAKAKVKASIAEPPESISLMASKSK